MNLGAGWRRKALPVTTSAIFYTLVRIKQVRGFVMRAAIVDLRVLLQRPAPSRRRSGI